MGQVEQLLRKKSKSLEKGQWSISVRHTEGRTKQELQGFV